MADTHQDPLFRPMLMGALPLCNRIVMAPLTRLRASDDGLASGLAAQYYAQRAGMGLIVTEGTFTSVQSRGYLRQPGIISAAHQSAWAAVADAVHERGGVIVMQLMHAGRLSHQQINGGMRILAPSAVAAEGSARTATGSQPFPVPHALSSRDAAHVAEEFATAAARSVAAGMDGVEVHGANGYLLHQFLAPNSNLRTDAYGGSPVRRARLVVEVATAVADAVGADRVGLRISPQHDVQGTLETDVDDMSATYEALLDGLRPLKLAYLSVLHGDPLGTTVQALRKNFAGALILNSGFRSVTTYDDARAMVDEAGADAVAVGRAAIANPDLVNRWKRGDPLNSPNPKTFYTGDASGYVDYPALDD